MSEIRSQKVFTGTKADRLALPTSNLVHTDAYLESDTGDEWEWSGESGDWYQTKAGGVATTLGAGSGVPASFTKETANTGSSNISKGNLNKINFIPRVLNEHVESSREVQGVITSSNIVGQIFKASKDNISALMLTLESAAGIALDDFESYADSAALQAAWVESGSNLATLEEVIVKTGNKAMSLPTVTVDDEWVDTITSTDYTEYTGSLDAYFSRGYSQQKVSIFIGDGTNTKSFQLTQSAANSWDHYEIDEVAMTEDGGGTTDITAITKIGFRVDDRHGGSECIIDNLTATPPPGDIEIKLWDMGATLPAAGVASINDGTQYDRLGAALASSYIMTLEGGKKVYHIHMLTAGTDKWEPATEQLTVGNYYLVQLGYVDTDVSVYGPDTSFSTNYYENGYAFTAPDEATAITAIGSYSDLMFGIFSTQDIYIITTSWRFDAAPNGSSGVHVFLEDKNMVITDVVVDHAVSPEQRFSIDTSMRPMLLSDGGKLEFYYNDDHTDSVTKVVGAIKFLYVPPTVNG